eukprot:6440998-Heterocapsa_arctica.AAC.1
MSPRDNVRRNKRRGGGGIERRTGIPDLRDCSGRNKRGGDGIDWRAGKTVVRDKLVFLDREACVGI